MRQKRNLLLLALLVLLAILFFRQQNSEQLRNSEIQTLENTPPKATAKPITTATTSQVTPARTDSPNTTSSVPTTSVPESIQKIRSKMKSNLSSAYASEKAFFAENGYYSTDFNALGFDPSLEKGKFLFKMGFLESYFNEEDVLIGDKMIESTEDIVGIVDPDTQVTLSYAPMAEKINFQDLKKFCKKSCKASADGFEMVVATNLDEDETLDVWLINQNKELEHVSDDFLK